MGERWMAARQQALEASITASDSGGALSIITKTVRMLLQSAILALGALLGGGGRDDAVAIAAPLLVVAGRHYPIGGSLRLCRAVLRHGRAFRALRLLPALTLGGAAIGIALPVPAATLAAVGAFGAVAAIARFVLGIGRRDPAEYRCTHQPRQHHFPEHRSDFPSAGAVRPLDIGVLG